MTAVPLDLSITGHPLPYGEHPIIPHLVGFHCSTSRVPCICLHEEIGRRVLNKIISCIFIALYSFIGTISSGAYRGPLRETATFLASWGTQLLVSFLKNYFSDYSSTLDESRQQQVFRFCWMAIIVTSHHPHLASAHAPRTPIHTTSAALFPGSHHYPLGGQHPLTTETAHIAPWGHFSTLSQTLVGATFPTTPWLNPCGKAQPPWESSPHSLER